ncbi:uncharacterized protein BO97DRAFT_411110 [Aspergillus homomorphus CBS 101889]|uniref:Serine hydrolase domain-containing protein n=1 Tax=Aspergillus homomorphus (strain CBS 101889) TaxID=1450537 RepID=A0A395I9B1_ASPHC|nr:hypothetical protein BO97DRAFT_411110 [Aspergillus homomorphus CBS 101889]RAL15813.1 hypothetical protein BO97DRAFT_411110 [Aspergillus homomorphus CBS 101889]
MAASTNHSPANARFRILMLHGYAQTAQIFRIKTRLLLQEISQSLSPILLKRYPGGLEFLFPDGPVNLDAAGGSEFEIKPASVARLGWWLNLDNTSRYIFLNDAFHHLADFLGGEPIHGVIGFSQGGALGMMLAAMCEAVNDSQRAQAVRAQNLPLDSFLQSLPGQQPLQFALSFCGFRGTMDYYSSLYQPPLRTPSFHAIGLFDTMITADESQDLVTSFVAPDVRHFFGGHFIPRDAESVERVTQFLRRICLDRMTADVDAPEPSSTGDAASLSSTASVRRRSKRVWRQQDES